MWDSGPGSRHVVERNRIVNCARGIGFGLGSTLRVNDGVVRNNMIFSEHAGSSEHEVGIMIEGAQNVKVHNNTVFMSHPSAYSNAIEYRFDTTVATELVNNLTNRNIASRDGAQGSSSTNVSAAAAGWFVAADAGDLHLSSCDIAEVDGAGTNVEGLTVDFDNEPRGSGSPDIGADQCN
jgi:hypothetical protein